MGPLTTALTAMSPGERDVLLDALLVRLLLVPVLLRLMGTAAWRLPRPLARVLPDVRFGHGE